jgi:phosphoribosylaminoimidazole carboxylase (NCAIR synthetase)
MKTPQALTRFARDVDVCTYEFENVPSPVLTALAAKVPVYTRRWLRWK